jgi:hypothetical protein
MGTVKKQRKDKKQNLYILERLDQGHLHPKLEVPGLTSTCPCRKYVEPGPARWEASTLEERAC